MYTANRQNPPMHIPAQMQNDRNTKEISNTHHEVFTPGLFPIPCACGNLGVLLTISGASLGTGGAWPSLPPPSSTSPNLVIRSFALNPCANTEISSVDMSDFWVRWVSRRNSERTRDMVEAREGVLLASSRGEFDGLDRKKSVR